MTVFLTPISHRLGVRTTEASSIFASRQLASPGVMQLAETGSITTLETELQTALDAGTAPPFIALRENISAPVKNWDSQ